MECYPVSIKLIALKICCTNLGYFKETDGAECVQEKKNKKRKRKSGAIKQ